MQICSYYPLQKLYARFFESLEASGLKNQVYVFVGKGFKSEESFPENVTVSPCFGSLDRLLFFPKHWKALKDIISKLPVESFSLSHAHSLFSNGYIAYKLFKKYKIPYIVAVRNTDVNFFFKKAPWLRWLGLRIMECASKIIFISPAYLEKTLDMYVLADKRQAFRAKSVVIPNGMDNFWLENLYEERPEICKDSMKIIFAGAIDRNKNLETTIEACKILTDRHINVSLTAVGRIVNPEYNKIISENDFVKHCSHAKKEELLEYFRAADIFVMPSRHETFGLVYVEAMSQGLPVIYTKNEGFDGFFPGGEAGYAVNCNSAEEIADKLSKIAGEYATIAGRCPTLCKRFDWKIIASEYTKIYEAYEKDGAMTQI